MTELLNTVELGQVCTKISVGLAMAVTPFVTEVGVKLIRNQNIRPNRFDDSSVIYLDPEFAASQKNKTVRENDVVIVRTGSNIGAACVVPRSFDGSQSFTTLLARPDTNKLHPHFLAQFVNSDLGRSEVERLMAGGGKGNLNSGELERFRITLLPIEDQRRVVALLSCWDSAIEAIEKLIAGKERNLSWLIRRLYERRPHWKTSCLNDVLVPTRRVHGDGDYQIGSVGKNGIRPRSDIYSKSLSTNQEKNILVEPGWVCFGLSTESIAYGVNRTDRTYSVSAAYRTYEIRGADHGFIEGYLKAFNVRLSKRFLIVSARQGKAIDFDGLLHAPSFFPPISEQKAISMGLAEAQKDIEVCRKISERYRAQKRGLIQKLLTGEWRLPVQEEAN